jgi:hypothetical protein
MTTAAGGSTKKTSKENEINIGKEQIIYEKQRTKKKWGTMLENCQTIDTKDDHHASGST